MINVCKECGCGCRNLSNDVKQQQVENGNSKRSTDDHDESSSIYDEIDKLKDDLHTWQDKYKRLSDAYKRVQRLNQGLEDKLLRLVDACESDKNVLTMDVAVLSEKLAEANYAIKKLTDSNERYKNDVSLAIQFLQCKQSNYVMHKFDSLPAAVQSEVSVFMSTRRKSEEKKPQIEPKSIKVPIPTFPPTAMVYSLPKNYEKPNEELASTPPNIDVVSAAIMAKILEERQRERMYVKHCDTCTCSKDLKLTTESKKYKEMFTQTEINYKTCEKVPNFELENCSNIVKVQPNNFLLEKHTPNASNVLKIEQNGESHSKFRRKPMHVNKNIIHVHKNAETDGNIRKISESSSGELENLLTRETKGTVRKQDDSLEFLDKSKYQEMEENVKRFLFKKTELWKEPAAANETTEIFSKIQTDI